MAALSIVALDTDAQRRLQGFIRELRGAIQHVTPHTTGTRFDVAVPDDKLSLLTARLATSGGFRWRQPGL